MSCKNCKYFQFNQNDMMGLCKLYPTVVNKLPQDWCGQEIPMSYKEENITEIVVNIDKPKRGRKPNAGKQKRIEPLV